jgi:hypothetical protein
MHNNKYGITIKIIMIYDNNNSISNASNIENHDSIDHLSSPVDIKAVTM